MKGAACARQYSSMDGFGVVFTDSEGWAGRVKLEGLGQLDTYNSPAFTLYHLGVHQCDDRFVLRSREVPMVECEWARWIGSVLLGSS